MYLPTLLEEWSKICASRRGVPSNQRQAFLETLFSQENASKFLRFRSSLGDDWSVHTLDLLVRNSLANYMGAPQEDYCFYSSSQWAEFTEQAKSADCIRDSYLLDIIETFVLEGYNYKNLACVKEGDVVLDCGAFTGNTTLYFSRKTGPKGYVHSFEPGNKTYRQLEANVAHMNLSNVSTHNLALSDRVGEVGFLEDGSPGARIGGGLQHVPSATIDAFVKRHGLNKVDFIKMDIEGAELDALKGSMETCRRFKPQLAICVYHKPDDLIRIPAIIHEILPGYRFYLRHNSNTFWETVLFAAYSDNCDAAPDNFMEEAGMLALWWQGVQPLWREKLLLARKHNMEMYDALLSGLRKMPAKPIFAHGYEYVFYPLSSDHRLHYEFFDVGDGIEISLHFEGRYVSMRDLIEEICQLSELEIPLRINSGPWKGCSYLLTDKSNHRLAAELMNYLVHISLPVLKKSRILANEVFFSIS